MNPDEARMLIQKAWEMLPRAYAPYSRFHVAAALLCGDGSVYTGFNIENAAFSPTICAERSAFVRALCDGKRDFRTIAICGGPDGIPVDFCAPCGVCRQVMREFCSPDDFQILLAKSPEEFRTFSLRQLLPEGFGPENLGPSKRGDSHADV